MMRRRRRRRRRKILNHWFSFYSQVADRPIPSCYALDRISHAKDRENSDADTHILWWVWWVFRDVICMCVI
jgi:hypothetical protein